MFGCGLDTCSETISNAGEVLLPTSPVLGASSGRAGPFVDMDRPHATPSGSISPTHLASNANESGPVRITINWSLSGGRLLSTSLTPDTDISTLRGAVLLQTEFSACRAFDLLLGSRVLPCVSSLAAAGLKDGDILGVVQRNFAACDVVVKGFSEKGLGCLSITCEQTGANLILWAARAGCSHSARDNPMCSQYYCEPAWASDDGDDVYVHYHKVVFNSRHGDTSTKRMLMKRRIRLRSDLVVAHEADDGMWVDFFNDGPGPPARPRNIFSGMRLEVLEATADWLHARADVEGDGWVQSKDVQGLGHYTLAWDGEEILVEEGHSIENRREPPRAIVPRIGYPDGVQENLPLHRVYAEWIESIDTSRFA